MIQCLVSLIDKIKMSVLIVICFFPLLILPSSSVSVLPPAAHELVQSLEKLSHLQGKLKSLSGYGQEDESKQKNMLQMIEDDLQYRLNLLSENELKSRNELDLQETDMEKFGEMYQQYVDLVTNFLEEFWKTEEIGKKLKL